MKAFDFILFYVPFRVFKYYESETLRKFSAIIVLVTIYMFHFLAVRFFIISLTGVFNDSLRNRLVIKYIEAPIVCLCILLVMFIFYNAQKEKYEKLFIEYDKYPENINKRLGYYCLAYFFFTIAFLAAGVTSSSWLRL